MKSSRNTAEERVLNSRTAENARIYVKRNGENGFTVWLRYSGVTYFMAIQRFNPMLYSILKDGLSLSELRHFAPRHRHQRRASGRFYTDQALHAMRHLTKVTEDFILYDLSDIRDEVTA